MMMVMMFTGGIVVVMAVPVVVGLAFGLELLQIMAFLVTAAHHGVLEILGAVGVVVILTEGPLVQQRVALVDTRLGAVRILYRGAPGVVVEMVEQLGVSATQGNTTVFRSKSTVVDVRRPPE